MGSHGTDQWRRRIGIGVAILFLIFGLYRAINPVPGMYTIITLLLLVTTVLFLFRTHTAQEALDRIRGTRRQLDPYDTLVAALTTGIMVLLFTYLVTYALMMAAYTFRRSGTIAALLFEAIQHIRLIESFHPAVFALLYIAAIAIVATGVFFIYPHVPIEQSLAATIVTFLAAWTYTLTFLVLILPFIHPLTLESLLLDAIIVVIWAYLFDRMYGKPLIPNPFLKRFREQQG